LDITGHPYFVNFGKVVLVIPADIQAVKKFHLGEVVDLHIKKEDYRTFSNDPPALTDYVIDGVLTEDEATALNVEPHKYGMYVQFGYVLKLKPLPGAWTFRRRWDNLVVRQHTLASGVNRALDWLYVKDSWHNRNQEERTIRDRFLDESIESNNAGFIVARIPTEPIQTYGQDGSTSRFLQYWFIRGFPSFVDMTYLDYVAYGPEVIGSLPITNWTLTDRKPVSLPWANLTPYLRGYDGVTNINTHLNHTQGYFWHEEPRDDDHTFQGQSAYLPSELYRTL
jgi:hypothetical protein